METQVVVLLVFLVGSHLGSALVSFEYVNPKINVPYIQEGDTFILKCKGAVQTLNWFHGEPQTQLTTDMTGSGDLEVIENKGASDGNVVKTIKWRNVPLNATGKFTCVGDNSPQDAFSHEIYVMKVTTPNVTLSNQTWTMLECKIVGLKETDFEGVTWSKDGTELVVKDSTKYKADESFTNATLTINNIGRDDGGAYTCGVSIKVSGGEAIQFSSTAEVYRKIEVDPFFKSASKNLIEEEQLKLKCKIFGHKVASVSWLLDNKPLAASDRVSFSKTKIDNDTLTITNLEETDRGDYACIVLDSMGNLANATVLIRVKDKYAALWPFLGICAEVAILCLIIFIYEKRRSKQMAEEDQDAAAKEDLLNSHGQKSEEVRKRNK